jgi:photosystem II stability/assembly factor-like uncharacterized protein
MPRWTNVPSPHTIYAIAELSPGAYLLGTNEGVWKYQNDACESISEAMRPASLTSVAACAGVILVGAADGIAYSTDDGATWTAAATREPMQISQILLAPNFETNGIAYAATMNHGVLRTEDRGQSWRSINFGLSDAEATALALSPHFNIDQSLHAAVMTGLFRSSNGGRSWRALGIDREALPISSIAVTDGALIVGSETHGLFHSTDGGQSWIKRSAFSSGPINALAVSPDGTRVAVATPMVVATSMDRGMTWERPEGRPPRDTLALAIADDGTILCGTQRDGLWVHTEV